MISLAIYLLFGVIFCLTIFPFVVGIDEVPDYEGPTDAGKKKLEILCPQPNLPCANTTTVYGFDIDVYSVIDPNKKILMEFSPKADCTSAVVAFFRAMGLELEEDYVGWPHNFREQYFYKHCGQASHCHYLSPDWFRFKVVRNPFDRAVSNYLHCIGTPHVQNILPPQIVNTSFEGFINYMLELPENEFQLFLYRHAGPQSQPYERYAYLNNKKVPPIFNVIVKAEDSGPGLKKIADVTGMQYNIKPIPNHYRQRDHSIQRFVGNITWTDLKGHVPRNYGFFYSKELIKKVETLYKWDVLLYDYSFPFAIPDV